MLFLVALGIVTWAAFLCIQEQTGWARCPGLSYEVCMTRFGGDHTETPSDCLLPIVYTLWLWLRSRAEGVERSPRRQPEMGVEVGGSRRAGGTNTLLVWAILRSLGTDLRRLRLKPLAAVGEEALPLCPDHVSSASRWAVSLYRKHPCY